jgi:hypothetical protein
MGRASNNVLFYVPNYPNAGFTVTDQQIRGRALVYPYCHLFASLLDTERPFKPSVH